MIYLGDDYIEKYESVFSYLIGRSISENYSLPYIQSMIANSKMCDEIENSNVTTIAFTSKENLYDDIFHPITINNIDISPYSVYGWLGYIYIHLFIDLKTTFEYLFYLLPIEEALNMYPLYHEMDYSHILQFVKEQDKLSHLYVVMNKLHISSQKLSNMTNISSSTITALKYNNRDFDKLEVKKALLICNALNIKITSLIDELPLVFDQ